MFSTMDPAAGKFVALDDRATITVDGADARGFLQGLVSNDMTKLAPDRAIYAALLTAQGKYLHDFFLIEHGGAVWLDCERARRDDLLRRLGQYRLRARVTIAAAAESWGVVALLGQAALDAVGLPAEPGRARPFADGIAYVDPRLARIGGRAILSRDTGPAALAKCGLVARPRAEYDRLRLIHGLPDSGIDLLENASYPLECGMEELNAVDFHKGCYVGQEVTARMKHRGLVRKRLMAVDIDGPAPPPGTKIMRGAVEAGELRSACAGIGIALLRLDQLDPPEPPLVAGQACVIPRKPAWAVF